MSELDLIRRLVPAVEPPSGSAVARARDRLQSRMVRRHRPRLRLALIASPAVAAVAAAVALTVGGGGEVASAAGFLRQAAALARELEPVPVPVDGQYLYVKSETAYAGTALLGDEGSFTVLEPSVREIWLGPDGGVIHEVGGQVEFLTDRDRQKWIDLGRPELRGRTLDASLSAEDAQAVIRLDLPTDPDALYRRIRTETEGTGNAPETAMFDYVASAFRESVVSSAQRAALYEVLARIPRVELLGPRSDRAGRTGVAVAIADDYTRWRHMLIIDPSTGLLLAEEQIALPDNPFGVEPGRLVGSATYLVTTVVDGLGERP
jgi:hypothetical protein